MIITATLLISFFKLLFIPAYRSTDFEVHRNWLAITHSLPVKQWYFENTSEWTLDYPPLFAWFEYFLAFFAQYFDKEMLNVENLNYASSATVLFQRLSVIFTDFLYSYGIYKCSKFLPKGWRNEVVLPIILITNAGLLMVDHIHFQYNGMMFGVLLLSIANMLKENYLQSAFWFSVLLNLKHIYIYLAPAYFVYLLRNYCIINVKNAIHFVSLKNFSLLASLVLSVFFVTYIPFYDQLGQIFARLFPFKRGLCHAYWAPNVWAIYNIIDKALAVFLPLLHIPIKLNATASMTGGLVQEYSHTVLPDVRPLTTMILTALAMLPAVIKLWTLPGKPLHFLRCLVLCALTSFLFGWHVHEKAILMAIIPLSVLAVAEVGDAKVFVFLCTVGHYSLFPLLFPTALLSIKVLLFVLHSIYIFYSLSSMYPLQICKYNLPLLNMLESIYLCGLIPLFIYDNFIHHLFGLAARLPFLNLMLTSVYCAIGVIYCWCKYYLYFLYKTNEQPKNKKNK